jgi:ankyrin repeat protein
LFSRPSQVLQLLGMNVDANRPRAKNGDTCLHLAAWRGHDYICGKLIDAGA